MLARDGKLDDARAAFAAIDSGDGKLETSGDVRARFHLALALLAQDKAADAKPLVDQILAAQPEHVAARLLAAKLETVVARTDPMPNEEHHDAGVPTPPTGSGGAAPPPPNNGGSEAGYDALMAEARKVADTNCSKAMDLYQKALDIKPSSVEALTGHGLLPPRREAVLERVLEVPPRARCTRRSTSRRSPASPRRTSSRATRTRRSSRGASTSPRIRARSEGAQEPRIARRGRGQRRRSDAAATAAAAGQRHAGAAASAAAADRAGIRQRDLIERAMARLGRLPLALVALAACKGNPSPLEGSGSAAAPSGAAPAADPWASSSDSGASPSRDHGDDDKGGGGGAFGGLDLKGMLSKIKDSIEKPGPYEAPEQSAGFDARQAALGRAARARRDRRARGVLVDRRARHRAARARRPPARAREGRQARPASCCASTRSRSACPTRSSCAPRCTTFARRARSSRATPRTRRTRRTSSLAACDTIGLAPLGDVAITGPAAMPIHVKGAARQARRAGRLPARRRVQGRRRAADARRAVEGDDGDARRDPRPPLPDDGRRSSRAERKLDPAAVQGLIDTAHVPARRTRRPRSSSTTVATFEAFRDGAVAGQPWTKLELDPDKDNPLVAALEARALRRRDAAGPAGRRARRAGLRDRQHRRRRRRRRCSARASEIASHTLVAALRALAADDSVKAVVLRVDSRRRQRAGVRADLARGRRSSSAKKPVIVSMSDVAASGGYYIASGATKIFALDDTLTGSIGVVGGKLAPAAALAKLGVTTFPMGRGKRATMMVELRAVDRRREAPSIQATMDGRLRGVRRRASPPGRHKTPDDDRRRSRRAACGPARRRRSSGSSTRSAASTRRSPRRARSARSTRRPTSRSIRRRRRCATCCTRFGAVQAPFGLGSELDCLSAPPFGGAAHPGEAGVCAELDAVDPRLASEARRLVELIATFQHTAVQTVAFLPVLQ